MKPLTKLRLKVFLFAGLYFGIAMVGIDLVMGNGFILWKLPLHIFVSGTVFSFLFVTLYKTELKRIGIQDITDDVIRVHQSRNLITDLNRIDLIARLKADPAFGKMKMKEIENGILLKTGVTSKSWGEEINIILKSENSNGFEYLVSSRPLFKLTVLDMGRNIEHINRIEQLIKNTN
jgi:hypothetical protein